MLEKAENIKEGMTEMFVTDDPHKDFDRHDAEQTAALEKMPVCCCCDEPIQDDYLCDIDGTIYCLECFDENFIKASEDYIK